MSNNVWNVSHTSSTLDNVIKQWARVDETKPPTLVNALFSS